METEKKIKYRVQKDLAVIRSITLSFQPRETKHLLLPGSNIFTRNETHLSLSKAAKANSL